MAEGWHDLLRAARRRLGLTQAELARLSGLSMQTVRAYERRRRHPTRPHLAAMLDAMRVDRAERNAILQAAGFAPDGLALRTHPFGSAFSREEAACETQRYRWPAFVTDEFATIVSINNAARRLWGLDGPRPPGETLEPNLFSALSIPAVAEAFLNWDEAASVIISVFKTHYRGAEDLENPSPQFRALLERFNNGDARYVARFNELWRTAREPVDKMRWSYPVRFRSAQGSVLRFHCFVSPANDEDGLSFHDWIPLDGATWAALAPPACG